MQICIRAEYALDLNVFNHNTWTFSLTNIMLIQTVISSRNCRFYVHRRTEPFVDVWTIETDTA